MLLPLCVNTTYAGWLIIELNEDRFGNSSMQSTFIQDQKLRIETFNSTIIIDLDSAKLSFILPDRKVYWQGKPEVLREGIFSALENQLAVMMAQMPANERDAAQKELELLREPLHADSLENRFYEMISISETDETDSIAGYIAQRYGVVIDSAAFEQVWLTRQVKPYAHIDLKKLHSLIKIITKPGIVNTYRASDAYLELINEGLVLRSVIPTPMGESVSEVYSVREADIPADFFLPPPDYRPIGLTEFVQISLSSFDDPQSGMPEW